jgi:hypothetical protein
MTSGHIRSLLSLISYFGKEMRERYLGMKIPPANLKPDYLGQAQVFDGMSYLQDNPPTLHLMRRSGSRSTSEAGGGNER